MFNNTNITQVSNKTVVVNKTPEDIKLNISKSDAKSFFIEAKRGSTQYNSFLQKEPKFIERKWHNYREGDYNWGFNEHEQRRIKMAGGAPYTSETPCTVLNMQYIGQDTFLFEIKLNEE